MRKLIYSLGVAVLALAAASCNKTEVITKPSEVTIQLSYNNAPLAVEGVEIKLTDASETVQYGSKTDASGKALFLLMAGSYKASATYKTLEGDKQVTFNGANTAISVAAQTPSSASIVLNKSERQQIIIKELYNTGCPKTGATGAYTDDAYVVLYNNSEFEADATDIVFTFAAPYNGHGTNKYLTDGKLLYENESWIPAYGAIWSFTSEVKIPAYSSLVVAIYGAVNHTAVQEKSVDLSNSAYYWMSNKGIETTYKLAKYQAAESIPTSHYLSCIPYTMGTAWALSNNSPAFYIGKMPKAQAEALAKNTEAYDKTLGTSAAFYVVKFPKTNVVDAVEVWQTANETKSAVRFPAALNTGHVCITNQLGHSIYRNVDKEATEALLENEGKLVYDYAGAVDAAKGDPSKIDAEASIAKGAHIIYSDTNDSGKDFHERAIASLKK